MLFYTRSFLLWKYIFFFHGHVNIQAWIKFGTVDHFNKFIRCFLQFVSPIFLSLWSWKKNHNKYSLKNCKFGICIWWNYLMSLSKNTKLITNLSKGELISDTCSILPKNVPRRLLSIIDTYRTSSYKTHGYYFLNCLLFKGHSTKMWSYY